jgi:2Fe-2S ferredoxin
MEKTVPKIHFVAPDGTAHVVDAVIGQSLMDAALNSDVPGIEGACGGEMACGTCHIYIDGEWPTRVGEQLSDELEAIDCLVVGEVRSSSRLACQITVAADLDGLAVDVAPS